MTTMRIVLNISLAIGVIVLSVPIAWAQQQEPNQSAQPAQPSQPIPAYHSPLASAANNAEDETNADSQRVLPDTTALTGVQDLSLGVPPLTHSYWQPYLNLSSTVDSNPLTGQVTGQGQTGWTTFTSVFGGVDLHQNSGNSILNLSYVGGGSLSNDGTASNGIIQGLNFSERLSYRRYVLSFFDQLQYAPQTAFGAAGIPNGPTLPGGGTLGFGNGYAPGQSILTARGQRLTNFSAGEVDVLLTPRTSLTFVGGYSLLDSLDDAQLNYGEVIFTAGYNYQISRKNTIGLSYQYSSINYSNFDQSIKSNVISALYGRRITGKLAFQASGGPNIALIRMPLTTAPGTSTGTGGTTPQGYMTQVYASINTALQYQLKRAAISAGYSHGISGGSGVLAGGVTDNFTGSVSEQVSRALNVAWNIGYARNRGIEVAGTSTANQTFDYWFTGVNVSHSLGRTMNIFLSYQLQYQNSGASVCTGPGCASSLTVNQITFGFGWHKQPIPF
jgi:hypothetical protein